MTVAEDLEVGPNDKAMTPAVSLLARTTMKLDSFKHLYIDELRSLYDTERQLLKALPAVTEAAVLPELGQAFASQLDQTQVHLQRLEAIFQGLETDPLGTVCNTMTGLLAEVRELVHDERQADPGVLDAALIAAMQKIAHYQIAGYGCTRTFAEILGEHSSVSLLQASLSDESDLDQALTRLALRSVNLEAVEATDQQTTITEAVVSALEAAAR